MGSEPVRCVGLSEVTMHEAFDLNIRPLVAAIKAFEGLTVIGGCAGHPDPQPDQWPEGAWYVMFTVQRTDQGWFALEFLAWAINNDYRRGGNPCSRSARSRETGAERLEGLGARLPQPGGDPTRRVPGAG
jgi:hypothetical protein